MVEGVQGVHPVSMEILGIYTLFIKDMSYLSAPY